MFTRSGYAYRLQFVNVIGGHGELFGQNGLIMFAQQGGLQRHVIARGFERPDWNFTGPHSGVIDGLENIALFYIGIFLKFHRVEHGARGHLGFAQRNHGFFFSSCLGKGNKHGLDFGFCRRPLFRCVVSFVINRIWASNCLQYPMAVTVIGAGSIDIDKTVGTNGFEGVQPHGRLAPSDGPGASADRCFAGYCVAQSGPRLQGHAVGFPRDFHGAAGRLTDHVEAKKYFIAAADRETLDLSVNNARIDGFDNVKAEA
jgi:hypothetical protein